MRADAGGGGRADGRARRGARAHAEVGAGARAGAARVLGAALFDAEHMAGGGYASACAPLLPPALGGTAIGAIAIVMPEILGVGYEATDRALNAALPLWLLIALVAGKIAATSLSLGSRFVGGVFSPSLFIGAMTGGAFGFVAASIVPELSSSQSVYAIAGMGAVAGAVLGAPISVSYTHLRAHETDS